MSTVSKVNGSGKGKAEGPNDRAAALLDLSISLVDQALDILTRHLKEDRQMTHASKLMPGGSVGRHFRHVRPRGHFGLCLSRSSLITGDGNVSRTLTPSSTQFAFDPIRNPRDKLRCYLTFHPPSPCSIDIIM